MIQNPTLPPPSVIGGIAQAQVEALPAIIRARYMRVEFDMELHPKEIPLFRGAVAEKMGMGEDLFHNHAAENEVIYRYPLIQYKSIRGHAAMVGLNKGADALQRYFALPERKLRMGEEDRELKIEDLRMQQVVLRTWNQQFHYRIQNWIALQDEAYGEYYKTSSLAKRAGILEKRLTNSLITMAKGLDWWVAEPIEVNITQYWEAHTVKLKGVRFTAFNALFSSNVFLPDYIGLGKGVALGFGVIKGIQPQDDGK